MFEQLNLFNSNKKVANEKEIVFCDLKRILTKNQKFIDNVLKSEHYAKFREYSVPLKVLDAVISYCNTKDEQSYKYLQEKNKPFSFNIAKSFEDDIHHMMTYSLVSLNPNYKKMKKAQA